MCAYAHNLLVVFTMACFKKLNVLAQPTKDCMVHTEQAGRLLQPSFLLLTLSIGVKLVAVLFQSMLRAFPRQNICMCSLICLEFPSQPYLCVVLRFLFHIFSSNVFSQGPRALLHLAASSWFVITSLYSWCFIHFVVSVLVSNCYGLYLHTLLDTRDMHSLVKLWGVTGSWMCDIELVY